MCEGLRTQSDGFVQYSQIVFVCLCAMPSQSCRIINTTRGRALRLNRIYKFKESISVNDEDEVDEFPPVRCC